MAETVPAEMVPARAGVGGGSGALRAHGLPVLILVLVPVLASAPLLLGMFDNDPALFFSGLAVHVGGQLLQGAPGWLDPTLSLLTQPLGRLDAEDWLHGIVPWWNPYSGIGMPLAAEMQSLSFFLPFVLLLKFWQGWLWLKIVLEIMSGLSMYALMIELGCRGVAALVPGLLFGLNAVFFLVPHAMGPVPFLPLLLLGIERAAKAAREGEGLGWGLIPLGLGYSLYGGYPEIAYIDGLLAGCWTLWRLATLRGGRGVFMGKIALGGGIGIALSLPLVAPFLGYVGLSYLGAHDWLFSVMTLGRSIAPAELLPLTYGLPGRASAISPDWIEMPGWFGLTAVVPALAGALRAGPQRGLARVLLGFVLVWQARLWGFGPAVWLLNRIPDLAHTDAVRFCGVAMEAAVFIMAGIGIEGWRRCGALGRGAAGTVAGLAGLMLVVSLLAAAPALIRWYRAMPELLPFGVVSDVAEIGLALGVLALMAARPGAGRAALLGWLIGVDAFAVAFLPQLAAPRHGRLDLAGVHYLQRHQGLARFYTLRPFGPDYPAAFGLASIDDNALPVAQSWTRYIQAKLDPYADVVMFSGAQPRDPALPDQTTELQRNLGNYEAAGVEFVLAVPGSYPFRRGWAVPAGAGSDGRALGPGQSIEGVIPAGMVPLRKIGLAEVSIGTFDGQARGTLVLKLCAGGNCAEGRAPLDHAADDAYLPVRLDHELAVTSGGPVRYRISHPDGTAVAIWMGRLDEGGGPAPRLRLLGERLVPGVAQVFGDEVMSIYRLPQYRRFWTAPGCRIAAEDWNRVEADCAAPARLIRLMAWFPGWSAKVDGRAVAVGHSGAVFQSVPLPAGRSRVGFSYRPPGMVAAVAAALAAAAFWLGLVCRLPERFRGGRRVS